MTTQSPFAGTFPADTVYETIGDATVPWRLTSLDEEYAALRNSTAIFDLSGCGLVSVTGPDAEPLLTRLLTREVEFLSPESSVIGLFLDDDATPLDIVTVYRTDDGFLVETSVGRGTSTLEHLQRNADGDVEVRLVNDEMTLFGFEGPDAWAVTDGLFDERITGLPFQGVRPLTVDGAPATVFRTGFTGEFGFKVLVARDDAAAAWSKAAQHAVPIGHEALEVAMLEFRQPILHREAANENAAVIRAGLNWLVDREKEDFLGRDALLEASEAEPDAVPVCFVCDDATLASGARIGAEGQALGIVVHVVRSPGVGGMCGVAHVAPDCAASGVVFEVIGSSSTVRTVSAPMRIPTSWGEMITAQAQEAG
jgi:aminomethyltransferase